MGNTNLIITEKTLSITKESKSDNTIFVGENGGDESSEIIGLLFDSGVEEIIAIKAEVESGEIFLGKVVLKLPVDSNCRKKVFEWNEVNAQSLGFDGDVDEGQNYLFVMFD